MKTVGLRLITIFCLCAGTTILYGQYQPTFTQYMFNEAFINPAYAGSHDALSLNGAYRNQWTGIDGAPVTQTLSAHTPLVNNKMGIGVTALRERIGVLKRSEAYLNYAYRIVMPKSILAFGLSGGFQSMLELYSQVKTIQSSDQQFLYDTPRFFSPNFGAGVYYYHAQKFFAGISVPRMIESKITSDKSRVINSIGPKHFTYYAVAGYVFDIQEGLKLRPSFMAKVMPGVPLQTDISLMSLIKDVVWLGASYRYHDAVSGVFGLQINKQFKMSYSYDFTLSGLQQYNSGSHEIQLSYLFKYKTQKVIGPRLF